MIADVLVDKPSRALNLVYVVFGYFLATLTAASVANLSSLESLGLTALWGGIISTFLFYVKPIDRVLISVAGKKHGFYYLKEPKVIEYGNEINKRRLPIPELFNTPLLAEDRAKINGAFFFAFTLLLSGFWLNSPNNSLASFPLTFILSVCAVCLLVIAVWESVLYIEVRLPTVGLYYRYLFEGDPSAKLLKNAVQRKDWAEARTIRNQKDTTSAKSLNVPILSGICPSCSSIFKNADYCPTCGQKLISICKECKQSIIFEDSKGTDSYCRACGTKFKNTVNQGQNHTAV